MPSLDNLLKSLTSNYEKVGSNVRKMMEMIAGELDEVDLTFRTIEEWRDMDNAEGAVLDALGENHGQLRGELEDDTYRVVIKARIARNKALGSINSIVEILAFALGVGESEIIIDEGPQYEPQYVSVVSVPFARLEELGITSNQLGRLISRLIAAGIGLDSVVFYGTMELTEVGAPDDTSLGLSDISMTDGGTLGALYQPSTDPNFPF